MRRSAPLLAAVLGLASCNGTTGDQLIRFSAYASGAPGAAQPFVVNGYSVRLTTAKMRIGAVYADEAPLGTQAQTAVCINPGVYAAQVPGPIEVDMLNDQPQEFTVYGNGSADRAQSWQIWLTDGDINEANFAHMVDLQGVATRLSDQQPFPFAAIVTINSNRLVPTVDPSQPGNNPICKQRIIQIGGIDIQFFQGGALHVTVDPRQWFSVLQQADFSALPLTTDGNCVGGDALVSIDPRADYGPPVCVPAQSDGECPANAELNPLDCTAPTAACEVEKRCIPDTNFASGPGSQEGKELFTGVLTGGAGAYSLEYTASP